MQRGAGLIDCIDLNSDREKDLGSSWDAFICESKTTEELAKGRLQTWAAYLTGQSQEIQRREPLVG